MENTAKVSGPADYDDDTGIVLAGDKTAAEEVNRSGIGEALWAEANCLSADSGVRLETERYAEFGY